MKMFDKHVLKAAAAPTTAYTGWVSDWFVCAGVDEAAILLTIVKGDATSFLLILEEEDAAGTTGFRTQKVTSGAVADDEVTITAANLAATDYVSIPVQTRRARKVRVKAKYSGGTGTGTIAAAAIGGGA